MEPLQLLPTGRCQSTKSRGGIGVWRESVQTIRDFLGSTDDEVEAIETLGPGRVLRERQPLEDWLAPWFLLSLFLRRQGSLEPVAGETRKRSGKKFRYKSLDRLAQNQRGG